MAVFRNITETFKNMFFRRNFSNDLYNFDVLSFVAAPACPRSKTYVSFSATGQVVSRRQA